MKVPAALLAALVVSVVLAGTSSADHSRSIEHPARACSAPFHVQAASWDFCWQQDDARAQGVELNHVYFHGEPVLWKISFPFSITQYEHNAYGPFKDTLGASFGTGQNPGFGLGSMVIGTDQCPRFLGVGVLLNDQRICLEERSGPEPAVVIWGRYDIFNYRFIQGYQLDSRGTIEPFVRLGGLLIDGAPIGSDGTNHFHHLYWRADLDIGLASDDGFQMFVRPDEAWNDWDPYIVWTPDEGSSTVGVLGPDCSRFEGQEDVPPHCRSQDPGGTFAEVDPLAGFPEDCRRMVEGGITGWCDILQETALPHHASLGTKWRTMDDVDTNFWDHAKSFESNALSHHDHPVDGAFTSFNAMVLQHRGDAQEIGFEVPPVPTAGDAHLAPYRSPAEDLTDPVTWFAVHAYHDTRDEEDPTMTYHHVSFLVEPRNFLDGNEGEDSYSDRQGIVPGLPDPEDLLEEPCIGQVCINI